jgi:hypothetical protein
MNYVIINYINKLISAINMKFIIYSIHHHIRNKHGKNIYNENKLSQSQMLTSPKHKSEGLQQKTLGCNLSERTQSIARERPMGTYISIHKNN